MSLSTIDYGFAWFYGPAGIGETVQRFGPQNRFKHDFALTDRSEHERLFAQIADSVNHSGKGLADIVYHRANGEVIDTLLRPVEVQHLQDVANLLDWLRHIAYGCAVVGAVLLGTLAYKRWRFPPLWRAVVGALAVTAFAVIGVVIYGPEKLFYQWHTAVFPSGHQWFFYYQDSLMTTLMRAPVIFGYIAALLVGVAVSMFVAALWGSCSLMRRVGRQP